MVFHVWLISVLCLLLCVLLFYSVDELMESFSLDSSPYGVYDSIDQNLGTKEFITGVEHPISSNAKRKLISSANFAGVGFSS